jgi:hypothetical protein
MAGDSGFQAQADAIARHATTVDRVADQVSEGRDAAAAVSIGRDAYGILCSLIPALLEPVQDGVIDSLREAAESLQTTADDLRSTARDYTGSDARTARDFGR